jgi:hypothetical protein
MVEVYRNKVSESTLQEFESRVTQNADMPWYYIQTSAYEDTDTAPPVDQSSFVHLAFNAAVGESPLAGLCMKALEEATADVAGIQEYRVTRIRLGMHTWGASRVINYPHVDVDREHMVGLLYLNDSDGDTVIYTETFDPQGPISSREHYDSITSFTKLVSITPEKGTFVFFNGKHYHSSSTPTAHANRVVVNFNLEK